MLKVMFIYENAVRSVNVDGAIDFLEFYYGREAHFIDGNTREEWRINRDSILRIEPV